MQKVSVSLSDDHVDRLETRQEQGDAGSRSEALRQIFDEYDELHTECEHLRTRCEELETELERVRNEKRLLLEERDEKAELVKYVEQERDLQERRQERRSAPAWKRARWWLFGRDLGDDQNGDDDG